MKIKDVKDVKVSGKDNPILGQHIEAVVELNNQSKLSKLDLKKELKSLLPTYAIPHRIKIGKIKYNHRFKKA